MGAWTPEIEIEASRPQTAPSGSAGVLGRRVDEPSAFSERISLKRLKPWTLLRRAPYAAPAKQKQRKNLKREFDLVHVSSISGFGCSRGRPTSLRCAAFFFSVCYEF